MLAVPVPLVRASVPTVTVCEPAATCELGTEPVPVSTRVSVPTPVVSVPLVPKAAAESSDLALLRALTRECNRLLAARPGSRPDERLGGVALVEPFTLDNGLLTQTLKQRRDRITARDAAAIESIYAPR